MRGRAGGLGPAALVGAAALWGSAIVTTKLAARGLPTLAITIIEVATAVALLGGLLLMRRSRIPRANPALLVAGALEPGLSFPLINAGLARTSGSHAALVIGLESVLVVVLDAGIERTRPAARVVAALIVSTTGVALLTSTADGSSTIGGDLLVLAGVAAAALYVVVAQRRLDTVDPVSLTFYQFLFGGLVILPFAAWSSNSSGLAVGHASVGPVAAAAATGVLGSAGAFVLYNWALRRVSTAMAALSVTLIPVFGIAFSALTLQEAVSFTTLAAAGAVFAGLALVVERTPHLPALPVTTPKAPPCHPCPSL